MSKGGQTSYTYDPATGELLTVDYSGATPDVTFTYDRLGRRATVVDAVTGPTGARTFTYRDSSDLQLDNEAIVADANGLYNKTIARDYEGTGGVPGRDIGFQVGTTADPDADYEVTYGYETATGRLTVGVGQRLLDEDSPITELQAGDGQVMPAHLPLMR